MKKLVVASWLWLKKLVKRKRKHSPESSKDEDSDQKQPEESQKPEKSPPDDGEEKSPTDRQADKKSEQKASQATDSQTGKKLEKDSRQTEKQPETKVESQKSLSAGEEKSPKASSEMDWTELHELKVLLVYKKAKDGGNKNQLCEKLKNKDKSFTCPIDSIKMKFDNIKALDEGKGGLKNASEQNKDIFKKYKGYSIEKLEKEIKNREHSSQPHTKEQKLENQQAQTKEQKQDSKGKKQSQPKQESAQKPVEAQPAKKPEKTQAQPAKKPEKAQLAQAEAKPAKKVEKAQAKPAKKPEDFIKLDGLFAFKMSMTGFYNKEGKRIPVTALKYAPCIVSQIKTKEKDSYTAVQVAFKEKKSKNCSKAVMGHLKPSGLKQGARFIKEIRQNLPENLKLGQEASIESLKKGDRVKISSLSKGRGFAGVMKRWNFAGGRASHGSKSHRRTGSIGQHTEPARVMPGRKMPGQYGFKQITISNVPVVEILPEENMIFVKGPVPGARNTMVSVKKMPSLSP